ncbi:MAG: Smr/MutS family protein, partial [Anaerolineales bacterium]|nr:Smr/MutS family protein [Anaerolineales bacterium]
RAIRLGDKVRLRTLGSQGVVTALSQDEAEVQLGVLRVRARLAELELASGGIPRRSDETSSGSEPVAKPARRSADSPKEAVPPGQVGSSLPVSPGIELDLRGRRADDALEALERYLDSAFVAGLPFVRIIHGKGTGRLREVIRQALGEHAYVKSFESGGEKEGGDGVTVAKMAV